LIILRAKAEITMKALARAVSVLTVSCIPLAALATNAGAAAPAGKPKTPMITVVAAPNPVIETAASDVAFVIQVEARGPASPGDTVTISSTELASNCLSTSLDSLLGGGVSATPGFGITFGVTSTTGTITVPLDNDGNVTVVAFGSECSPGEDLIEASDSGLPFHTATTKLTIDSPKTTSPGIKGYPADEVETGDGAGTTGTIGTSDVYAVFLVEAPATYSEDSESIASDQLTARCGAGSTWLSVIDGVLGGISPAGVGVVAGSSTGSEFPATGQLIDDNGNVAYVFVGASCAAGTSTVVAAVTDGPTYRAVYKILPPAVTI
jgi:hypothetical protein